LQSFLRVKPDFFSFLSKKISALLHLNFSVRAIVPTFTINVFVVVGVSPQNGEDELLNASQSTQ
jgi:hypothetical protein